jgi:hypothetical protein
MPYGAQIKFGIARQASAGTGVTAATSFHGFAHVSHDIGLEREELISQNRVGRFEQGAAYDGVDRVLGTIEFEATPRNMLAALAACVNHAPVSVTSGSLRTYTFLPNTEDFSSTLVKAPYTVYSQFTDAASAEHFFDVQFGQLEFQIAQGQFLRGRLSAAGGRRTATGIGSLNVLPDAADVGALFPWNTTSVSIGGIGVGENSDITITLNENVEPLYTVNASREPYKYARSGFREVTISGTLYLANRDRLNDFVNGTQRRLLVTVANTRTAIQSGYFNTLTIDVPQMKITALKLASQGPGEVAVNFTGRGVLDPSSNYAIQFTAISTWAAGF